MANLTLVIDDDVLKRARIKALELGTSVNAVVREQLALFVDPSGAPDTAMRDFVEIARRSSAGSGPGGRTWTRDELYER